MMFEKVALMNDMGKIEEKDFMTSFYKEYVSSPKNAKISFMARMGEDIVKRRWKDDRLQQAEKRYRRSKYGSLSQERVWE